MFIECKYCQAIVDAVELGHYDYRPEGDVPGRFTFLRCAKCDLPMLASQDDYGAGLEEPSRVYPADHRISADLPHGVRAAYSEAVACVKGKAFTAAAIMCRKTLEGACKESGAAARSLRDSLKGMRDKGIIDGRLADWADALRMSGNEAAHDIAIQVSAEDARDLIEFTGAFLDNVFLLRSRFDQFMSRRETSNKAMQTDAASPRR